VNLFTSPAHANCAPQFVGLETQYTMPEIDLHIKLLINNLIIFNANKHLLSFLFPEIQKINNNVNIHAYHFRDKNHINVNISLKELIIIIFFKFQFDNIIVLKLQKQKLQHAINIIFDNKFNKLHETIKRLNLL